MTVAVFLLIGALFLNAFNYRINGQYFSTLLYQSHLGKIVIPAAFVSFLVNIFYLITRKKWSLVLLAIIATHYLALTLYQIIKTFTLFPVETQFADAEVSTGMAFYLTALAAILLLVASFGEHRQRQIKPEPEMDLIP